MEPVVPTLTKVRAPMAASSSTAIAVDGEPMPVEQTEIGRPSSSPVYMVYSRFWGDQPRPIEQSGNWFAAPRSARQQHGLAHIAGTASDVVLGRGHGRHEYAGTV